jgi:hypothetical protein
MPSARKARMPLGCTAIPAPTASHAVLRSTSTGSMPRRCSAAAKVNPAMPPPAIKMRPGPTIAPLHQ